MKVVEKVIPVAGGFVKFYLELDLLKDFEEDGILDTHHPLAWIVEIVLDGQDPVKAEVDPDLWVPFQKFVQSPGYSP